MKPESFSILLVIVIGRTGQEENHFVKKTNIHGYITCHFGKRWGNACLIVYFTVYFTTFDSRKRASFDSVYYLCHNLPL